MRTQHKAIKQFPDVLTVVIIFFNMKCDELKGTLNCCLEQFIQMQLYFVVVYFILSRLLYLAVSTNLGLLHMLHPGMGPLVYRPL